MIGTTHEQRCIPHRQSLTYPFLIGSSLAAILLTVVIASSSVEAGVKPFGFSAMIAAFSVICAGAYWQRKRKHYAPLRDAASQADIGQKLAALDEAGEFFAGSLRLADSFRFAANRVRDLLPFSTVVLYLVDGPRTHLRVADIEGMPGKYKDQVFGFDESLAGQSYLQRDIAIDTDLSLDATQNFGSSAAIPLLRDLEVFGVLELYFGTDFNIRKTDRALFEAVGSRVAPLLLNSIAFERSQTNALTDLTTDLPNERAFYLILENQIAEAHRKREERPLSILAIDIKDFDEINRSFGHPAGDALLNFVARIVRQDMRQMDFLARSTGDEFLAVLPTASEEIATRIVARLHSAFFGRELEINDESSIEIQLNIGWATFGRDGETPDHLLGFARLRKEQAKSVEPNRVLWFPREIVN